MKINLNVQRYAVYYIVGYGTEIQNNPVYSVQWAGKANSGYSFGVTQADIGQEGRWHERVQLSNAYNAWRTQENNSGKSWPVITVDALAVKGQAAGNALGPQQKEALNAFLITATGKAIVDQWDAGNVSTLLATNAPPLDAATYFGRMSARDQFIQNVENEIENEIENGNRE